MKAKEIQQHLQEAFYKTHPYQTLNYKRSGYEEADVFLIHKSNLLVTEIEVKVSISDFRADFKKKYKHYKMTNYKAGLTCPSFFYYACQFDLIPLSEIPIYAGLIYVMEDGSIEIQKKAPKIHKDAATQKTIMGVLENLSCHRIFGCQYMTYENKKSKQLYEKKIQ